MQVKTQPLNLRHSILRPPRQSRQKSCQWASCFAATSRSSHGARTEASRACPPPPVGPLQLTHSTAGPWMGHRSSEAGACGQELKMRAGREGAPGGRGSVRTCQLVTRPSAAGRAAVSRHPLRCLCPLSPFPFRSLLRYETQTRGYE